MQNDKNKPPQHHNPNQKKIITKNSSDKKDKQNLPAENIEKQTGNDKETDAFPDYISTATLQQAIDEAGKQTDSPATETDETADNKIKIGITIGDINGIGAEVILKTLSDNRMLDYCTPIVYGSSRVLSYHRKVLKIDEFTYHISTGIDRIKPHVCNVINCWNDETIITIGRPNPDVGVFTLKALEQAVNDLQEGKIDALVTAPVNKYILSTANRKFIGHTEYITNRFGVKESLMLLVSDELKVGLVTNHLPVKDVAAAINPDLIWQKLQIMHQCLSKDFGIARPKIAVLSLNPHAGDNGLIGTEEEQIIMPVIEKAKQQNLLVFGPFAADGFFGTHLQKQFDAVLAMYHDQGLIPFKALSFGLGVNYTAGLPVVRTSPDHGTAYDIAGKNIASEESFRKSVFLAIDIVRNRRNYQEMYANPLRSAELKQLAGIDLSKDEEIRED
ncbi:4-hydroxythreonine-4-phosphate dehydrogenase PdxA [Sphingobacteriales bacterium UPWRP_1]|nr:4-hydroxythreonine-4-phosphate dehydrogenase PdxA [Sphingobacteriales bacterium TSM_CSM]PSJ79117.1 4-hydroxythreonine-4-phosphate dehydrogenase PdxA [Sphingobacteriales bacterium UPWRP_1]